MNFSKAQWSLKLRSGFCFSLIPGHGRKGSAVFLLLGTLQNWFQKFLSLSTFNGPSKSHCPHPLPENVRGQGCSLLLTHNGGSQMALSIHEDLNGSSCLSCYGITCLLFTWLIHIYAAIAITLTQADWTEPLACRTYSLGPVYRVITLFSRH